MVIVGSLFVTAHQRRTARCLSRPGNSLVGARVAVDGCDMPAAIGQRCPRLYAKADAEPCEHHAQMLVDRAVYSTLAAPVAQQCP